MKILKRIMIFLGLVILLTALSFGLLFIQGKELPIIFTGLCILAAGFMISDAIKNNNKDK